jgi:uncharacterized membrane protein HdeD (DUF308 family)/3',5'-cyclic AMP phosphodiesterase CpdA
MASERSRDSAGATTRPTRQRALAAVVGVLGALALVTPLRAAMWPETRVGGLLIAGALLEIFHGFRRSDADAQRSAWFSGGVSLLMGILLVNAPALTGRALALFLAAWFAIDGLRSLATAFRSPGDARRRAVLAAPGIVNIALALGIALMGSHAVAWTVSIAGAVRLFATASNMLAATTLTKREAGGTALSDLGFEDRADLGAVAEQVEREEAARAAIDRGWIAALLAILFAVHLGRMGTDRTLLSLVSPAVALMGDIVIAWIAAFALLLPAYLVFRKLTRGIEHRAWAWTLAPRAEGPGPWARRVVRGWLLQRFRFSVRLRASRYSLGVGLRHGLQVGLPVAAILAATIPVWGMSWYFDTENWAAGMWNSWAESRTDEWREAMVNRVDAAEREAGRPAPDFTLSPPGIEGDFSFIVIGDTGEGDASQHSLRDQLLRSAWQDEVKFVVLSSDVVYPVGAMRDYETKFWLPFKGVEKPVYAIPGNHDWYDALEAFAATFFEPEAARLAMQARADAEHKLTSTTDARIDELIRQAAELRGQYRVPTGFQEAPFFQIQTGRFALIAVDTGVVKGVDPAELAWLRSALDAARGKFTMVVLGHPLYAGGVYQAEDNEAFTAIHRLLQEHEVQLVMAGDTHDLEYYVEPPGEGGGTGAVHIVNGGGGAYMSFGTALAWPASPATAQWAFYPTTAQVTDKLDRKTPAWKWPAWLWTRGFGGWPFSAEGLAGIFDYNVAPFFQSFIVVRVEPSANRVRLWPLGVHGRLTWADIQTSPGLRPAGVPPNAPVEWTIPF